jgi:hypothetical protein
MNVGTIASAVQSSAQEALETAAQTKAEAAKGDQQAIRKLARAQAANPTQEAPQATQSLKRGLDVKA